MNWLIMEVSNQGVTNPLFNSPGQTDFCLGK